MSQDTRKDKRAKVVSLNVRYKSATVDEFIENHSHDVSRGGIFVKTPTPFPPGTLLKFEIRLAGDKSVISGVGRVVWKREPTQAGPDRPAGMGVKFIKIDEASRAVIDKLVATKADAGSAYLSDPAAHEDEAQPAGHPTTLRGLQAAASHETGASASTSAAKPAAAAPPPVPSSAKVPPAAPPSSPSPGATRTAGAGASVGARAAGPKLDKTLAMGGSPFTKSTTASTSSTSTSSSGATGVGAGRPGGPPPPMAHRPATAIGVGPPPQAPSGSASGEAKAPAGSAVVVPAARTSEPRLGAASSSGGAGPPRPQANVRKATMMGVAPAPSGAPGGDLGEGRAKPYDKQADIPTPLKEMIPTPAVAPAEPSPAPKPVVTPMFPKMEETRRDAESVKEPTVMKQAAELLEEALREAGGSMEEIGHNPLFAKTAQREVKLEQNEPPPESTEQSGDTLLMATSPLLSKGSPATAASPSAATSNPPPAIGGSAPPASVTSSAPPASSVQSAKSVPPPSQPLQPVGKSLGSPPAEKKGVGGLIAGLAVVAILAGGGVYAYRSGALSGVTGGGGVPTATATTEPTEARSASPVPTPSDTAEATATDASVAATDDAGSAAAAGAAGDAGADTTASEDAGAAAAATTATAKAPPQTPPAPRPAPPPRPKPAPTPSDTDSTPSPEPTTTATSTSTPTATATSTATAAPTTTTPPTSTSTSESTGN